MVRHTGPAEAHLARRMESEKGRGPSFHSEGGPRFLFWCHWSWRWAGDAPLRRGPGRPLRPLFFPLEGLQARPPGSKRQWETLYRPQPSRIGSSNNLQGGRVTLKHPGWAEDGACITLIVFSQELSEKHLGTVSGEQSMKTSHPHRKASFAPL